MWHRLLLINAALLICFALTANAKVNIKYLHFSSSTVYRFNTVKVTSRIQNDGTSKDKLIFQVSLPNEAFVTGFSMKMDKIHIEGRIVKQIHKFLTDKTKKTITVGNRPRGTSHFKIIIHAPPAAVVTFSLSYQNMLQRRHGFYEQVLYIKPGQVVEDLKIVSKIFETRNITEVNIPPLKGELINDERKFPVMKDNDITIDGRTAKVVYKPTVADQKSYSKYGIDGLYTIKYDILHGKDKGDIIRWNGYFFHFFSASELTALPKDIVFVLDDSASMTGDKAKNMKEAMYLILDSLNVNDRFMFVQFSNLITPRETGFVKATRKNIKAAKEYVRKTYVCRGGTNINDAIIEGLKWFDKIEYKTEARSSILLFLTDGRASSGERLPSNILRNIKLNNNKNIQIYAISFGADADYGLMQQISFLNDGHATRVYDASDSAQQLKYFFEEISEILIKNIKFDYDSRYVLRDQIAWSMFRNYFEGSEIITSGKLSDHSMKEMELKISGKKGGSTYDIDYLEDAVIVEEELPFSMTKEEYGALMERMWAFLTIKYWITLRTIGGEPSYMETLERKIKELSVKYSFLTEGSSMVLKSFDGEGGEGGEAGIAGLGMTPPEFEQDLYGEARVKKAAGARVYHDPHFTVNVPELDIPVCFEILAKQGDMLLLLEDPVSGVRVSSSVIESQVRNKDGRHRTYLGDVFISTFKLHVRITPHAVHINGLVLSWKLEKSLGSQNVRVVITGSGSHVSVIINNSTHMLIQRYLYGYKNRMQVNYLNFYITDDSGLSSKASGLLGYFAHAHVNTTSPQKELGMPLPHALNLTTTNRATGKTYPFTAKLVDRQDVFETEYSFKCWRVLPHQNVALFGGIETGKFFL